MVCLVGRADKDEGAGSLGVATLADVTPPGRIILDSPGRALLVDHAPSDEPLCGRGNLLMCLEAGVFDGMVVR